MSDHALSHVLSRHTHTAAIASAAKTRRNWKGPATNLILKHASFASEHVTLDKRLQKWVESLRNCWHSITKKCHGWCHLFQKPSALQWKRVRRKCMQEMVGQERRKDIKKCINFINMLTKKIPYRPFGSFLSIFVIKPLNKATVNVAIVTSGQSCYFGVWSTRAVISWEKM